MNSFGSSLARLRRDQGYASARAFFLKCGGRRTLGLTYANYLNLERGKSLPKVSRLEKLFAALGLREGDSGALARAYFLSLGASERLLALLGGGPAEPERRALSEEAALLAQRKRTVHLGVAAWTEMSKDAAVHALCRIFGSTKGWVPVPKLAKMAKLDLATTRRALERLAKHKLVKLSRGRASSPYAGALIEGLPFSPATAHIKAALRRDMNRFIDEGKPIQAFDHTIRTTAADLQRYLRHLEQTINLFWNYEDLEPGPDSAIYHVQARAVRLWG